LLRESEERYRALVDAAPVGIGLSTLDGRVLVFNRRLCELSGLTLEEALSLPADAFYVQRKDRDRLVFQLRAKGHVSDQEVLYRRKDGTNLLCLISMQLVRLAQREVVLTIVQDITRQKQAERHLEGLVALLSLFAAQPSRREYLDAVVRLLRTWCQCQCVGIRLFESAGLMPYAAQIGFSRPFLRRENNCKTTASGCACARALAGSPRAGDLRIFQGSFFCDSALRFARQISRRGGRKSASPIACVQAGYRSLAHAPIRYNGRLIGTIHFADSRPNRFPASIINYIESIAPLVGEAIHRFRVEESLHESETRFRSLFESHAGIKLLVDPETRCLVDANPAAAAFYGYDRAHLCSLRLDDLTAFPASEAEAHVRKLSTGHGELLIVPHRLASGEIRTMELQVSPVSIGRQRVLYCILHDVTERKRLEQEVVEISERERQHVGQDLHDSVGGKLTGVALIAKALAQSLQAKGLKDAELAEEVVQCLNECIAQTRSIARGLCPVELSVSGLTSALVELALEQEKLSGIECRFEAEPGLQIHGSFVASHLFRLAQEALSNALRHARPTRVQIRLARRGSNICLEINDNGGGFNARRPHRSGIGLRSMRYRAEVIGAQFSIVSNPGGGTVVSCLMPARDLPDNQMELWQQS
jgi:PAS domain S-box-containing protein